MLDLLATARKPLSALVAPLDRYFATGELNRRVRDVPGLLARVEAEHRAAGAREISHMDGLLVRYPDWWFNLRPSNTEPMLRLNLEASSEAKMVAERDRLFAQMEAADRLTASFRALLGVRCVPVGALCSRPAEALGRSPSQKRRPDARLRS